MVSFVDCVTVFDCRNVGAITQTCICNKYAVILKAVKMMILDEKL